MSDRQELRTFIVYVENRPGVLNRISSLFRRRGYNIESLTVGHTERPGVSRMTIVAGIGAGAAHRVEANIYKLVNVLSVEDVTNTLTVSRSLALIKVEASEASRHRLMEIVRVLGPPGEAATHAGMRASSGGGRFGPPTATKPAWTNL